MKLLLTSNGLSNSSIVNAFVDLVGKPTLETTITVVPTASNNEIGDKTWYILDLIRLKDIGFKSIQIVDFSAVDESVWRPQLEVSDAILFQGGSTYHLMQDLSETKFDTQLKVFLESKVYVGISAGSMVSGPDLQVKIAVGEKENENKQIENITCLSIVDFYIEPHLNSKWFPFRTKDNLLRALANIKKKVYVLDDNSALKVSGSDVEVISEGAWFDIN